MLALAGLTLAGTPSAADVSAETPVGAAAQVRPPRPTVPRPPRTTTTRPTTKPTTTTTTGDDSLVAATDGTPVTVSQDGAAGIRRVTFSVRAGQRIIVGCREDVSGLLVSYEVTDPEGARREGTTICFASTLLDTFTAPVAGTYTIAVDLSRVDSGSVSLAVHTVPDDVVVRSPLDGSAVPLALAPGQRGQVSFSAEADQRFLVYCAESESLADPTVGYTLLDPAGQPVETLSCWEVGTTGFTVAGAGTYTLTVDPAYAAAGTVDVVLYPETIRASAAADGTALVTTVHRGQRVRIDFPAGAGQHVLVACLESSGLYGTGYELKGPDGEYLWSTSACPRSTVAADVTAETTGHQQLTILPTVYEGSATVTVRVWVTDDVAVTAPTDGTAVPLALLPGQQARVAFTAAAGQHVVVSCGQDAPADVYVLSRLLDPAGGDVGFGLCEVAGGTLFDTTVTSTGTYTIVLDPWYAAAPTVTVAVRTS